MIRGTDGYDYESLSARLLGERAITAHNFHQAWTEAWAAAAGALGRAAAEALNNINATERILVDAGDDHDSRY